MSRRIRKELAQELILFVKKIEITGNIHHDNSTNAFEFWRQMASPKLQKVNPTYECLFKAHKKVDAPTIKVEFTNNTMWEQNIGNINCNELRSELFSKAEQIGEDDDEEEWDASKEDDDEGGDDSAEEEVEDPKAKKGAAAGKAAAAKPAATAKTAPAVKAAKK